MEETTENTTSQTQTPVPAATTPSPESSPQPMLRDNISLTALTFGVVFILVGFAAIAVACGAPITLWGLTVGLLGTTGLALLVSAVVTSRR